MFLLLLHHVFVRLILSLNDLKDLNPSLHYQRLLLDLIELSFSSLHLNEYSHEEISFHEDDSSLHQNHHLNYHFHFHDLHSSLYDDFYFDEHYFLLLHYHYFLHLYEKRHVWIYDNYD